MMVDRIVVVEDDRELRDFLVEMLSDAGYEAEAFPAAEPALRRLTDGLDADLVLTDLILPGMPGEELLRRLRSARAELNVIVMTAFGTIESAKALVRDGAFDYLTKPLATDDLLGVVARALEESRWRRERVRSARDSSAGPLPGFVGASRPMQELYALVVRVAATRHPILVTGESGTGKELVARALHERSGRQAFIAVNCGALPEQLLESELFGHERGAFTGAAQAAEGLIEAAHGGTLFLDEIGEMPITLQPKLLRAIEEAEVRRVGATRSREVDVRIIAASNRDLEQDVETGRFREDLYHRLNVLPLHVPPLRARPADVPLLAEHFLEEARRQAGTGAAAMPRSVAPDAMALLTAYAWPGNVRELRNAILWAATLSAAPEIRATDLPPRVREGGQAASLITGASEQQLSLRDLERLYILEVLRQVGGNKSRAAEILGLDRKTLYRKLEEYRVPAEGEHPRT